MSPDEEEARKTAMERTRHAIERLNDLSYLDERRRKNIEEEEREENQFPVLDTVEMLRES